MTRLTKYAVLLAATLAMPSHVAAAADVTSTYSGASANWSAAMWINVPNEGGFPNNGNGGFTYDAVLSGGGTLTLDQSITIQKLAMTGGGAITGTFDLTTNDTLHWTSGTMSGAGTTTANGGAQFDGYVISLDGRTLNIAAPATFTGNADNQVGYLYISNGATLTNSSTFDAGWAANFNNNIAPNGVPGTFNNSGTFTRSVGTGTTSVTVPFNNSGIVTVQAGTLGLSGGGMDSGSFQVAAGTTLGFAGSTTLTSAASLSVGGNLIVNGPTTFNTTALTGSGSLSILSNGTLTVTPTISTSLALNIVGGTLNGGGAVTFGGAAHWTDGTMSGTGTTTANGGLQIDGYSEYLDGRTLNVAAPATFTGNVGNQVGYFYVTNGSTLNNSSTFDAGWAANFNNNIAPNGVPGTFNNSGTFTRSVGTGTTSVTVPFNNSGIVTVQAGTLGLSGGGMDSGSFQVAAGTTLGFAGSTTLTSAASLSVGGNLIVNGPTTFNTTALTGSGSLSILSNGTLTVTPTVSTSLALNIVGGTLNGGGAVTFGGAAHWTDGTMSGTGTTTANGGLQIDGYSEYLDGRTLNVAGPATFTGNVSNQVGYFYVTNGSTLNNSSTFDAGWAANFNNNIAPNGVPGTFNNSGTFTRSVGSGTTSVTVPFNNSGIVTVQAGTLGLSGGGMDSGSFQVAAGTTLGFAGSTTLTSTASLSVGGTLIVNGPTTFNTSALTGSGSLSILSNGTLTVTPTVSTSLALNIVGGTLNGGGAVTFGGAAHWTDGTMSGTGTTTANGGLQIDGYSEYLDGRTLNVAGPATFTGNVSNQVGYFYVTNGSTLNNSSTFDAGWAANFNNNIAPNGVPGTFNNSGTFTRSVGSGTTSVTVPFNNSGIVTVQAGTLALSGGGMDSGSFQVAAGTTLGFAGSTTLTSAASLSVGGNLIVNGSTTFNTTALTGSGSLSILSNGTLTVTPTISTSLALNIVGGTLNGGGAVTFGGAAHWTDGTMSGTGTTTANGGLQIDGYSEYLDGRTLNVAAPATFTGNVGNQVGYFYVTNGSTLNNSSTFDAGWAANFNNNIAPNGVPGTFNNSGTFTRSVGTGATTLTVPFVNNGTVDLKAGTLEFAGGLSVGNNSSLKVSAGLLKINTISGMASVGSGVTASISDSGVLQLAGSVSSLGVASPAADRVAILNNSTAAAGLLVSGSNQQVGAISGSGNVQVSAGGRLTADSIIATALLIGGVAGNPARVAIAVSNASGHPVAEDLGDLEGGSSTAGGLSESLLVAGIPSASSAAGTLLTAFNADASSGFLNDIAHGAATLGLAGSSVPEPSSVVIVAVALLGFSTLLARHARLLRRGSRVGWHRFE